MNKVTVILCTVSMLCSSTAFAASNDISDELCALIPDIESADASLTEEINTEEIYFDTEPKNADDILAAGIGSENETAELSAIGFDGGSGTEDDPYLISTETQLNYVTDLPDKSYKLTKDIKLKNDWTPIGTYGDVFSGCFDGDGHTISSMIVKSGGGFIVSASGTIKNLNIKGSVTSTDNCTGGIVGTTSGMISNCSFTGNVTNNSLKEANVGGIAGSSTGAFENCRYSGNVLSASDSALYDGANTGGLVGYFQGTSIIGCHSDGAVTNNHLVVDRSYNSNLRNTSGGLVGHWNYSESSLMSDCMSSADVTGVHAGGIVGYTYASHDTIQRVIINCIASGNIRGGYSAGGFAGYAEETAFAKCASFGEVVYFEKYNKKTSSQMDGYADACGGGFIGFAMTCRIQECYSLGRVSSTKDYTGTYPFRYAGGFAGQIMNGSDIENCYSHGSAEAEKRSGGFLGYNNSGSIKANITSCYSTGASNYGFTCTYNNAYVTNCYYDSQTSGCSDKDSASPKTSNGMKNQMIYNNWDFDNVWVIDDSQVINHGYPCLKWAYDPDAILADTKIDNQNNVTASIHTLHPIDASVICTVRDSSGRTAASVHKDSNIKAGDHSLSLGRLNFKKESGKTYITNAYLWSSTKDMRPVSNQPLKGEYK